MPNIASLFKSEIARIARKEIRAEVDPLKRANSQHRSAIAALRREMDVLQRMLKQQNRVAKTLAAASEADETPRRFSAARLAVHRQKLGLSAAAYGALAGVSGATIYNWEQGKTRPNLAQLQKLVSVRKMSRSAALQRLQDLG